VADSDGSVRVRRRQFRHGICLLNPGATNVWICQPSEAEVATQGLQQHLHPQMLGQQHLHPRPAEISTQRLWRRQHLYPRPAQVAMQGLRGAQLLHPRPAGSVRVTCQPDHIHVTRSICIHGRPAESRDAGTAWGWRRRGRDAAKRHPAAPVALLPVQLRCDFLRCAGLNSAAPASTPLRRPQLRCAGLNSAAPASAALSALTPPANSSHRHTPTGHWLQRRFPPPGARGSARTPSRRPS
jgi:hypothetical protein